MGQWDNGAIPNAMELGGPNLIPTTKINQNVEGVELLNSLKKTGINLHDLESGSDFLGETHRKPAREK